MLVLIRTLIFLRLLASTLDCPIEIIDRPVAKIWVRKPGHNRKNSGLSNEITLKASLWSSCYKPQYQKFILKSIT